MARTLKHAKKPERFSVVDDNKIVLEVKYFPDALSERTQNRIDEHLVKEMRDCVEPDELSTSCPYFRLSTSTLKNYVSTRLGEAVRDLLYYLFEEAYEHAFLDVEGGCRRANHHHPQDLREALKTLGKMHTDGLKNRLNAPMRGGSSKIIKMPTVREALAREYSLLLNDKSYGEGRNKSLWQMVCDRYESEDPKWKAHAKVDQEDIPDVILDLVPVRHTFKPKLKPSDFSLLHAASRTRINWTIASRIDASFRMRRVVSKPSSNGRLPSIRMRSRCMFAARAIRHLAVFRFNNVCAVERK